MKKHISVLMLMARSTIYRVFALLVVMAAVQTGLFWLSLNHRISIEVFSLELTLEYSWIGWTCMLFFLLLSALLCTTGFETKSRLGYTLMRLRISGRGIVLWQSLYNTLCFLLFWAVQILISFGLCVLYTHLLPEHCTNQTIFLAFYRSGFLRTLLPFEEPLWWVGNILLILGAGILTARIPTGQRNGERPYEGLLLVCALAALLSRQMGDSSSVWLVCICAVLSLAGSLYMTFQKEVRP